MDQVLHRIEHGHGRMQDLDMILDMCANMKGVTICVLSDACAMPVEAMINKFREEFEYHIREKRCPAKVCKPLIRMEIQPSCTGCMVCARNCPVEAITGERRQVHHIDDETCIRCGICVQVCNFNAIAVES